MKTDLPFEVLSPSTHVEIVFDGQNVSVPQDTNLAAALLSVGLSVTRFSDKNNAQRGPFCMMGSCFECVVEIDGVAVQACMQQVTAGMVVSRCTRIAR